MIKKKQVSVVWREKKAEGKRVFEAENCLISRCYRQGFSHRSEKREIEREKKTVITRNSALDAREKGSKKPIKIFGTSACVTVSAIYGVDATTYIGSATSDILENPFHISIFSNFVSLPCAPKYISLVSSAFILVRQCLLQSGHWRYLSLVFFCA